MNIIACLVVGMLAGWLAERITGRNHGLLTNLIVGIVGALIGWVLFTYLLGIGDDEKFDLGGILGSIVGVMVVLLVLRAVGGNGKGKSATSTRGPAV